MSEKLFGGGGKIVNWVRRIIFLALLKSHGKDIHVRGPVYVWNNNTSVGSNTTIYPGVAIWGGGNVSIGEHVDIGMNTTIFSYRDVQIKDNVLIAAGCYIIDSNHVFKKDMLIREQGHSSKGPLIIEEDVWIGAGAKILSGAHIGKGVVIGAQAVVNSDIPENAIVVGIPARVIGYRK